MRRKNRHKIKRSTSLVHRRKYRFVTPNEDMRVLWNPGCYIARYAALVLKDYIPYNDTVGGMPNGFSRFDDDKDSMKGYQEWRKCLEEMLFAFEFFADDIINFGWLTKKRNREYSTDLNSSPNISTIYGLRKETEK